MNLFTNVENSTYYADAILWAVKEETNKENSNITFSPNADYTRAQTVAFIWRQW